MASPSGSCGQAAPVRYDVRRTPQPRSTIARPSGSWARQHAQIATRSRAARTRAPRTRESGWSGRWTDCLESANPWCERRLTQRMPVRRLVQRSGPSAGAAGHQHAPVLNRIHLIPTSETTEPRGWFDSSQYGDPGRELAPGQAQASTPKLRGEERHREICALFFFVGVEPTPAGLFDDLFDVVAAAST